MRTRIFLPVLAIGLLLGTGCLSVKEARRRYAETQEYRSLRTLSRHLRVGMDRTEVEALLGTPLEHPGNGQYCYLSDREETVGVFVAPLALVVDYREPGGEEVDRLAGFYFVAMAE